MRSLALQLSAYAGSSARDIDVNQEARPGGLNRAKVPDPAEFPASEAARQARDQPTHPAVTKLTGSLQ